MRLRFSALPLTLPQRSALQNGARPETLDHIAVEITWGDQVGDGVAVPSQAYGTDLKTVGDALGVCAKVIADASPFQLQSVLDALRTVIPGQQCAIAAVDLALHDLLGKSAGLPLYRLLGLEGLPLPATDLSLSVTDLSDTIETARRFAHWPILKLKMTEPDEEIVRRVREVFPGQLWIDANGAWSATQALDAIARFQRYGVAMIEQPVARGRLDQLRFVHQHSPVPILSDQDCVGPQDVARLAGCASAIEIKLLRCGGISSALEMIRTARRLGLKVMLGCVPESVLGITAMAQLGGLADFLDLDGHIDLLDDPFEGVLIESGRVILPAKPGLGVSRRQKGAIGNGECQRPGSRTIVIDRATAAGARRKRKSCPAVFSPRLSPRYRAAPASASYH